MRSPVAAGILLLIATTCVITAMSAMVRLAAQAGVPIGQIVFWRSAVALLPICAYMFARGEFPAAFRTAKPGAHALRAGFGALSMALSFLSLAHLPVASAQALGYLAPILVLPLAALWLRDPVGWPAVVAVAAGAAGMLLVLDGALALPGDGAAIGVAAGLAFAATMAIVRVHVKGMTATERPATIAVYFALAGTAAGLVTLPFGWVAPDGGTLLALVAAGLLGGIGHVAGTEAIARTPVATLAPIEYTGLLWALAFDAVLFATWPDPSTLAGAALIVTGALVALLGPRLTPPRRAPRR